MFEEKLKRTYFHVKPLDHKQLKTWDQYLDYEIQRGDHERIVVLFERSVRQKGLGLSSSLRGQSGRKVWG